MPDPKFAMGHKCSEFTPPVVNLGADVAPLGMKFYTGDQFPAEYKNNILIAEHGSWNRHKYQGARIVRVITDPQGKNVKQEVLASGWINGLVVCSISATTVNGLPAATAEAAAGDWVFRIGCSRRTLAA